MGQFSREEYESCHFRKIIRAINQIAPLQMPWLLIKIVVCYMDNIIRRYGDAGGIQGCF
jgi:hypothetical protein